ncbi:zinc-ribbon domain-containing protein [Rhodovulum tesquicola]|uniref:zinc-ribbon domain-containing protein n=1 Tax=Rhodovulum tesquicola TaxID=540254 RepID=UPI0020969266|nr:zinc-ribbon domain-containing protein [Rhodovulum tesquicola]MCO8145517.1 zinc-ribbon domain-containing protein [Rhodovulum tesquicola]
MRLICPNCNAQYEVDAAVIPDEGRDVQCSNCGHTWFQRPAGADAARRVPEAEDIGWHGETTAPPPLPESEPAPASAARRALDASVLDILQEEAAREQRARAQEAAADTFAAQPDLGLDSAPPRSPSPVAEPAAPARPTPEPEPATRRDQLPDLAEINASLDASSDRGADSIITAEAEETARRSGFRLGFALVVLVAALAVGAYLLAPQIAELHPALDAPMAGYVGAIDGLRLWLRALLPRSVDG